MKKIIQVTNNIRIVVKSRHNGFDLITETRFLLFFWEFDDKVEIELTTQDFDVIPPPDRVTCFGNLHGYWNCETHNVFKFDLSKRVNELRVEILKTMDRDRANTILVQNALNNL